jgi:hypothetical protein
MALPGKNTARAFSMAGNAPGTENNTKTILTNMCGKGWRIMHPFYNEIRKEFPHIKPFVNDDLDWYNQATDFLIFIPERRYYRP